MMIDKKIVNKKTYHRKHDKTYHELQLTDIKSINMSKEEKKLVILSNWFNVSSTTK